MLYNNKDYIHRYNINQQNQYKISKQRQDNRYYTKLPWMYFVRRKEDTSPLGLLQAWYSCTYLDKHYTDKGVHYVRWSY